MKLAPRSLVRAVAADLVVAVAEAAQAAASAIATNANSRISLGAVIVEIAAPFFCGRADETTE